MLDHYFRKKDVLNYTTKAQTVTMIANSELNENGIILSDFFLVGSTSLVSPTPPLLPPPPPPRFSHFLKILLSLQNRGRGIGNNVNL